MKPTFDDCLRDLVNRFDETQEQQNRTAWQAFLDGTIETDVFIPPARRPAPPRVTWPTIHINDAQDDYELMLWDQFRTVSDLLAAGGVTRPAVRCNYGTGILPSLFGCQPFRMPRETNTLPSSTNLGSREKVQAAIAAGPPDLHTGIGEKVFQCAARFQEVWKRYPQLAKYITAYHPDLQGPLDAAEIISGSELYLAFVEEPEFVHALLDMVTETYRRFMHEWNRYLPQSPTAAVHWGWMQTGLLVLRNDSLVNISAAFYEEFVRPCDEKLLAEFGGGVIHACGRMDHCIAALSQTHGLTGVNLTQPELNQMETVYQHTIDRGIKIFSLSWPAVVAARAANRPLHGRVYAYPA